MEGFEGASEDARRERADRAPPSPQQPECERPRPAVHRVGQCVPDDALCPGGDDSSVAPGLGKNPRVTRVGQWDSKRASTVEPRVDSSGALSERRATSHQTNESSGRSAAFAARRANTAGSSMESSSWSSWPPSRHDQMPRTYSTSNPARSTSSSISAGEISIVWPPWLQWRCSVIRRLGLSSTRTPDGLSTR